ncbi:MAG TPA: trehalose-6-phosphate synthase [Acidimicrobiales bacterium]
MGRAIVIVSNRGPLSFTTDDRGDLVARRGAGGLVSGLAPLMTGAEATWIASAISDGDRLAAGRGTMEAEGLRARLLAIDPETYRQAYDLVSNETLWFIHHGLYDLPRAPAFNGDFRDAWLAYRRLNERFAGAVAEDAPHGAVVLVQDYHLALMGHHLATDRPDLATVHFTHTPFAPPDWLGVLPDQVASEYLSGMAAFNACGFHTQRWADEFLANCRPRLVSPPRTFVSPLPADIDDARQTAASPACAAALAEIEQQVGDRRVIGRSDRIELSKNLVRGFLAYDDLLSRYPEWREQVVFVASVYPSRQGVADYVRYQDEVEDAVARINERWANPSWQPVILYTSDDYPRSVALLRRADVLLVNPIRDGLNLVAKEGALVNERDAVLCLSPEAGVWAELGAHALELQPFDVAGTADTLDRALRMPADDRRARATALREVVESRRPADWLADQMAAATG